MPALLDAIRASHGAALDAATQVEDKLERQAATKAVETAVFEQHAGDPESEGYAERRAAVALAFDKLERSIIRERIAIHKKRPDGRAANEIRDIDDRSRRDPAHPRLGAVHARADAGAQRRRARHAEGGDAARHARPRDQEVLLAPLQLPALLGRGGGPPRRAQAPRHRPRSARRARARAGRPLDRGLPLQHPRGLRHPRVQRLVVDGVGLRQLAVADGCRRADRAPGRGHRDGADQGGRRLRRADRHRRRRGPPRRHGLQGRRHRPRNHRAADGHQDLGRHVRDPARRADPGPRGPHVHPRGDGQGHRGAARVAQRATRRGSRRSRSTPARSGC